MTNRALELNTLSAASVCNITLVWFGPYTVTEHEL